MNWMLLRIAELIQKFKGIGQIRACLGRSPYEVSVFSLDSPTHTIMTMTRIISIGNGDEFDVETCLVEFGRVGNDDELIARSARCDTR